MLHKLRERAQDEKGFTLIELLVVILIIGILAAIALPAFLSQRGKAQDTDAKTMARTAQTALESVYTDNQDYTQGGAIQPGNATASGLATIEPALAQDKATVNLDTVSQNAYSVTVTAPGTQDTFTITKNATTGDVTHTCTTNSPNKYGCPGGGYTQTGG